MNNGTRIFLIILCILMIAIGAASIYFAASSVFAEEIEEPEQTTFVNFNQWVVNDKISGNVSASGMWLTNPELLVGDTYYISIDVLSSSGSPVLYFSNSGITGSLQSIFTLSVGTHSIIATNNNSQNNCLASWVGGSISYKNAICINLTQMFGTETVNTMTLQQCNELFKADYYPYNTGTTIDLSGFEQYNAGAMSARESMTINTTSANIAENLDNVVINSSYGSSNKALIQGYMVWGTQDQYTNCTALFNLETNFNENDYFEFEFYTITGADSINLPNISTFYDLQIIAVDSSGNIVPLATIKAQDNSNTTTKATFYLPFSTDKLYITTPHKYIIGYNNFKINITTTNLTALSLYSYKDGYKAGMSAGYTNGYNNGINGNNAAITSMDYIKSAFTTLGDILTIEVFPNVPLGTFFLLPLMASLIFFIVKVSKGG